MILPAGFVLPFERFFSLILIASLILIISFCNRRKIFFITAIISLFLLVFFDQMRLQPWVYQYFLLLVVFALNERETENKSASEQTLGLVQIIIAGFYFWSGLQKLNFSFTHETLPILLSPLQNVFTLTQTTLIYLGLGIALLETLIGGGLLWKKTRNSAVCFAVVMHVFILCLLIAASRNSIVWVWNVTLIFLVVAAFWQSNISFTKIFSLPKQINWKNFAAKLICYSEYAFTDFEFFRVLGYVSVGSFVFG